MNLPQIILFIVLTIMGTFYMVADRKRIFAFFERWIPQRASGKLKLLKDTVFRGCLLYTSRSRGPAPSAR